MHKKVTIFISSIVLLLVLVFAFNWRYYINSALEFSQYIQLATVPPPPEVQRSNVAFGSSWVIAYQSTMPSEEILNYYKEVLPQQEWTITHIEERQYWCIAISKDGNNRFIENISDRDNITRLQVGFQIAGRECGN